MQFNKPYIFIFLLVILFVLFISCNNADINEREKEFYNMAFDSLFEVSTHISPLVDSDNLDSLTIIFFAVTNEYTTLEKRLAKIPPKMDKRRDIYIRIGTGFLFARDALFGTFEFYVNQYWDEYFRIDSIIRYLKKIDNLSRLQKLVIDSLQVERKQFETITINRFQTYSAYLYNKKDSLKKLGWENYQEWIKNNCEK